MTYLAGADLVKRYESKSLGHHGGGEVLLGDDEGDENGREEELREEGEGFDGEGVRGRGGRAGGGEVEEDVVGAEVVAVVDAGDVVEVGVDDEGGAVPRVPVSFDLESWK